MKKEIKKSLFPLSLFWTVFGLLLLTAGVNVFFIILGLKFEWKPIISVHLILAYWILVSFLIVFYIKNKIHKTYEIPLLKISEEIQKVSHGDFSVQIPTIHEEEKYDYLDLMITNLNTMIEDLNGIETLRTDFISNVSHEMKTPLAAMQNYATMLSSPDLTESERLEYTSAVSSNCRRLTNLVTNILKLNKIENQQIFPKVSPYDLGEELRECILGFETVWSEKNLELEAIIQDGIQTNIDKELLSLVWNNILSNAIKFTPEGGIIKVSLKTEQDGSDQKAIVTVTDSGCGMDEKTKAHIFEKFYQGDTSHASKGNGLGLALASRVVSIAGGTIEVKSEVGKGSQFFVKIPLL